MAQSTAPILLTGGTTMLAEYLVNKGVQWRIALATGIGAGIFALLEKASGEIAVGLAWVVFVGAMVTPNKTITSATGGKQTAPIEVFLAKWNANS